MRVNQVWFSRILILSFVAVVLMGTSSVYAGNIVVIINGQTPPAPSQANCDNAAQCVVLDGDYGVIQVKPVSTGSNSEAYARIDVPANETTVDNLQIINARIINNDQANEKSFTIVFEREDVSLPNSLKWYNTYLNGNFGAVAGNSIISQSFYKPYGGTYAQIGSNLIHTVSCPFGACATPFTKKTGIQRNPGASLRSIKMELTILLKAGSFVDLNSGGKIITSNNPPDVCATMGSDHSDIKRFNNLFTKCTGKPPVKLHGVELQRSSEPPKK